MKKSELLELLKNSIAEHGDGEIFIEAGQEYALELLKIDGTDNLTFWADTAEEEEFEERVIEKSRTPSGFPDIQESFWKENQKQSKLKC